MFTLIDTLERKVITNQVVYNILCQLGFLLITLISGDLRPGKCYGDSEMEMNVWLTRYLILAKMLEFVCKLKSEDMPMWWRRVGYAGRWINTCIGIYMMNHSIQDQISFVLMFTYFLMTEAVVVDSVWRLIRKLDIETIEYFERWLVPFIFNSISICMSVGIMSYYAIFATIPLLFQAPLLLFVTYTGVYLRAKFAYYYYLTICLEIYREQKIFYSPFRVATREEIKKLQDVCSICLGDMTTAWVTQCNHFYHSRCIKSILDITHKCPMCQQRFLFRRD